MKLVDGFFPFFQKVKEQEIKTALVSSTSTYTLGLIDQYFSITHLFDLLVTEKDTVYHKPDPASYIKALEILPASIDNTVVIEDSPNGIISERKVGCKVFDLITSFSADRLTEADDIFDNYAELFKKTSLLK